MANPNGVPANLAPAFKPGQSGNPGGKPVAARNRLQVAYVNALIEDFEEYGKAAIVRARKEDPVGYLKCIASLMPKQLEGGDGKSIVDLIAEAAAGPSYDAPRSPPPAVN